MKTKTLRWEAVCFNCYSLTLGKTNKWKEASVWAGRHNSIYGHDTTIMDRVGPRVEPAEDRRTQ
jgi:hypothetical protein